jgi:hypothetical protein
MRLKDVIVKGGLALTLGCGIAAYSAAADLLLKEQQQGDVAYLSGGVGEDEARAMESKANDYPLTLEFLVKAQPRAQFTSDVKVKIEDHAGKVVLDTVSDGPFLLVRLPPGRYAVTASLEGEAQARRIHLIEKRPKRVIFEWNAAVTGARAPVPPHG